MHRGVQLLLLNSAECNFKFYGSFSKAFWTRKEFSGTKFNSDVDVHTIHFRFLKCDSQYRKLGLKFSVQTVMKESTFREQFST